LYNDETTYISSITAGSNGYVVCWYNGYEYRFYNEGNEREVTGCAQSTAGLNPLRNGFYRMNIKENGQLKTYVYFDWRDTGFTVNVCRYCSGSNDMTIRYNGEDEELWFWNNNGIGILNQSPDEYLINGQLINWAELNCTPRTTLYLEDFWSNALVLVNNGNNRPLLVWGPYPSEIAISNYEVYRDDGSGFTKIATVNSTTYEYTDNSVTMSQPGITIYYKVKPTQPIEAILPYTNTVNTTVVPFKIKNINSSSIYTFSLNQNYPNPFNPTTTVAYSIKRDGYVSLQVYDILGNEVAALVNERKIAGNYLVEFDTGNLPSGVYFYTLTSGNFTYTRKMILLR